MSSIKIEKNGKTYEYSYQVTSENPLTVSVTLDSHSDSVFRKVNGEWHTFGNQIQPPNELSISDIGKAIDEDRSK